MKLLIIEDEYKIADAIKATLEKNNYKTKICTDGLEGYEEALSNIYDLIILDVMLPNMQGTEILEHLKTENINSKIIMLTAKSTIEDKMQCFNSGVDDYITKPFHMDELLARINIQLRKDSNNNELSYEDLILDTKKMTILNISNNKQIEVIGKEYELLEMLLRNHNQILEKELVFNKIWGFDNDCDINTLEAYISFIRKKLKLIESKVYIKTIRNVGYKLEVNNEEIKS